MRRVLERTPTKRIWIALLAIATALVIVLPAGAKPDKPGKPNTGFKPMACQVDDVFESADVRNAGGTSFDVPAPFTLIATEQGGFNETLYTVDPGTPGSDDVLCVEVTNIDGTLSDLRVRWLGCEDCGLYRATGKDLRNFNNGEVFSAGVGVVDWADPSAEKTVAVMPNTKSDTATMTVRIGIDHP